MKQSLNSLGTNYNLIPTTDNSKLEGLAYKIKQTQIFTGTTKDKLESWHQTSHFTLATACQIAVEAVSSLRCLLVFDILECFPCVDLVSRDIHVVRWL